MMKNVCGKTQPQQQKMLSKATKDKQPLKQTIAMTQPNLKFVMARPMLTTDELNKASQPCINLHNYYFQNYQRGLDIIVSYKHRQFLVGDGVLIITFSYLYDCFNLDMLDVSLMRCFAL
jgi:hypothetical protein